jgi:hypothetical protein
MGETMSTVQQAIEVTAPLHAVYEQLAHLENYPQFMTGVEEVIPISAERTHWIMDLDGEQLEFDAELTDCAVDQQVAWRSTDGPMLAETLTLRPVGETRTQIVAQLEADAAALMPSDRHAEEALTRRLKADLDSFKQLIEHDIDLSRMSGMPMSGTGTGAMGIGTGTGTGTMGIGTGGLGSSGIGGRTMGMGASPTPGYGTPGQVAGRIGRGQAMPPDTDGMLEDDDSF